MGSIESAAVFCFWRIFKHSQEVGMGAVSYYEDNRDREPDNGLGISQGEITFGLPRYECNLWQRVPGNDKCVCCSRCGVRVKRRLLARHFQRTCRVHLDINGRKETKKLVGAVRFSRPVEQRNDSGSRFFRRSVPVLCSRISVLTSHRSQRYERCQRCRALLNKKNVNRHLKKVHNQLL